MSPTTRATLPFLFALVIPMGIARPAAAVDPGSELITCDRADQRVEITVSSHLDPSCTWTRGVRDPGLRRHARLPGRTHRRRRIVATGSTSTRRPTRRWRTSPCATATSRASSTTSTSSARDSAHLAEGVEYENGFSNITIEDSTQPELARRRHLRRTATSSGVTLRNLHVEGAGSTGIYLEAGSKNCVVENSTIVNNGFGENSPHGGNLHVRGRRLLVLGHRTRGARRSTDRASTSSATTPSRATPPAASSSTRTAANS